MNWTDELRRLLARLKQQDATVSDPGAVTCQQAAERIFEWLDGDLDPKLTAQVGTHLETCARCYPRLRFERAFREALTRAASEDGAPEGLHERVLESLRDTGFSES